MRNHHLRRRRERLGFTQFDVAQATGIRYANYISLLEAADDGMRKPRHDHQALANKVRRFLIDRESACRQAREAMRKERARIAFQRSLWAALPDHPAVRALKAAMLDRCLDLMREGAGEECDAIAEFLPEAEVDAMFDQWERECVEANAARWPCLPAKNPAS